ncbi:MAG: WecB/TagA/CpsF family glycosyltransferase [Candidatus Polarisedimenticolia bacterium]
MKRHSSVSLGGVRLDGGSHEHIVSQILEWCASPSFTTRIVTLVNAYSLASALDDPEFHEALNRADISIPDGAPVAWISRWLSGQRFERFSGPDLMHTLLTLPDRDSIKHFVYGGSADALDRLELRYNHGMATVRRRIVGSYAAPFRELSIEEEQAFKARLEELKPDILWVCLGTARQEKWMARMSHKLNVPVMAGVGAAVDFLSGTKPRAPRWLQRAGLEWLFRLVTEPRRLWKRYLIGNVIFLRLAVSELWQHLSTRRGHA